MTYKAYNSGDKVKTPEQMTMEEFHQDFAVARNIILLDNKNLLLADAEKLLSDWYFLIEGTEYEKQINDLRLKAKTTRNVFALAKGIRKILRLAAMESGFFGRINTATNKPA